MKIRYLAEYLFLGEEARSIQVYVIKRRVEFVFRLMIVAIGLVRTHEWSQERFFCQCFNPPSLGSNITGVQHAL